MDLKRRAKADPQSCVASLMDRCSKILVITSAYRQLIDLLNGNIAAAQNNPFYWEHLAGNGWHNVSNQNVSCVAYLIRQANDSYGLMSTAHNWGAIFVSARALHHAMHCDRPAKFSDYYHCEHTVPIKQRFLELID
jgi:hypothetical protein